MKPKTPCKHIAVARIGSKNEMCCPEQVEKMGYETNKNRTQWSE